MTKTNRKSKTEQSDENFFEVLAASPPAYDYLPYAQPDELAIQSETVPNPKTTAVITILLVLIAAILISVLIVRGLEALKSYDPLTAITPGAVVQ
jgi:hypothetical protein